MNAVECRLLRWQYGAGGISRGARSDHIRLCRIAESMRSFVFDDDDRADAVDAQPGHDRLHIRDFVQRRKKDLSSRNRTTMECPTRSSTTACPDASERLGLAKARKQ